jgi:hypothetical protein
MVRASLVLAHLGGLFYSSCVAVYCSFFFVGDVQRDKRAKKKGLAKSPKPLICLVPGAGIEPARYCYRQILSLMRLPVSPPRQMAGRKLCLNDRHRASAQTAKFGLNSILFDILPGLQAGDITPWLHFIFEIFGQQASEAQHILEGDQFEYLLSEKQLAFWQWAGTQGEFSCKDAMEALGFPSRTVEGIIKKLWEMKKLERLGQGRATRYRVCARSPAVQGGAG